MCDMVDEDGYRHCRHCGDYARDGESTCGRRACVAANRVRTREDFEREEEERRKRWADA